MDALLKLVAKLQLKLALKKAHNYLYSVSVMYVYTKYISLSIGCFRVSPGLSIKTRLSAQPLIWKWLSFSCK